jgi:hypothetical protein
MTKNSVFAFDRTKQKVASKLAHLTPDSKLGDGVQSGYAVIGYKGKQWSLKYQGETHFFRREDDGSQLTYLDVVIVGSNGNISKAYRPGAYDEDSSAPPVCSSLNGDAPDPGVPEPQSQICPTCPHYGWTTINGRRAKACQDHRRLAVMLMPSTTKRMLGHPLQEPVYLKIPPASLTTLKSYSEGLQDEGVHYSQVVTRISWDPDHLFRMIFVAQKFLTNEDAAHVLPVKDDPLVRRITGEDALMRQIKPVERAKIEAPTPPPPQQPQPQAIEEDEDDEGAPVVPIKRGRGRPPKAAAAPPQQLELEANDDDPLAATANEADALVQELLNRKTDYLT